MSQDDVESTPAAEPAAEPVPTEGLPVSPEGQPGPVQGYPTTPQVSAYSAAPKTPGIAIAGLILAILFWPVGLVLSIIALGKTKRAGAGRGLAIGGIIVSVVAIIATAGAIALVLVGLAAIKAPGEAVTRFTEGFNDTNCTAIRENATASFLEDSGLTDCEAIIGEGAAAGFALELGETNIENDTATVLGTLSITDPDSGETQTEDDTFALVKDGGAWKVNEILPQGS